MTRRTISGFDTSCDASHRQHCQRPKDAEKAHNFGIPTQYSVIRRDVCAILSTDEDRAFSAIMNPQSFVGGGFPHPEGPSNDTNSLLTEKEILENRFVFVPCINVIQFNECHTCALPVLRAPRCQAASALCTTMMVKE